MGDRIKLRSDPLPPPKGREVRVLTAAISTLPPPAHSPPSPPDEKQRKLKLSPTAVGGAFLKGPGASAATPSSEYYVSLSVKIHNTLIWTFSL